VVAGLIRTETVEELSLIDARAFLTCSGKSDLDAAGQRVVADARGLQGIGGRSRRFVDLIALLAALQDPDGFVSRC